MSEPEARGPEDEDYERAWRPAVRQDYLPLANGLSSPSQWRLSSGTCRKAKTSVSGKLRNILLAIQVSVEKPRHITSLTPASTKKNRHQRSVSFRQPSSVSWNAVPKIGLRSGRPN